MCCSITSGQGPLRGPAARAYGDEYATNRYIWIGGGSRGPGLLSIYDGGEEPDPVQPEYLEELRNTRSKIRMELQLKVERDPNVQAWMQHDILN